MNQDHYLGMAIGHLLGVPISDEPAGTVARPVASKAILPQQSARWNARCDSSPST
jgi:hypothetical protein